MRTSVAPLSPPSSGTQAATCLLVRPAASAMSDAIQDGLRAAGLDAAAVSNVFDAVVEAEHAARGHHGSPARALTQTIVCVDHFGQQDFRLFPLMRREWPETLIVAFHSPGFDYKGRLAELLGADVVLGSAADVAEWAKSLVPAAGEIQPTPTAPAAPVEPPARPAPEPPPPPPPSAPTGLPPSAAYQYLARAPEPPRAATEPGQERPSAPPHPTAPESAPPPAPVRQPPPAQASSAAPTEVKPAAPPAPPSESPPTAPPAPPSESPPAAAPPAAQSKTRPGEPPAGDEWVEGNVIGTVELTDEELRLLLGEEEGA